MDKIKKYSPKKFTGKRFSKKKPSARAKGYDQEWERYRWRFLYHNPTCYVCGKKSTIVDHVVPGRIDGFFWKVDNYMPLCKHCHDTITGKFDRHTPPKTIEKLTYVKKLREERNLNIKIKVVPFKKGSGLGKS